VWWYRILLATYCGAPKLCAMARRVRRARTRAGRSAAGPTHVATYPRSLVMPSGGLKRTSRNGSTGGWRPRAPSSEPGISRRRAALSRPPSASFKFPSRLLLLPPLLPPASQA
jgi:hypothetical protein